MSIRQVCVEPPRRPLFPVPFRLDSEPGASVRAESGAGCGAGLAVSQFYASERRHVPAGTELVSEFETCANIYVVLRGWMALRRILEDGRQQILDFALPGAFVGDPTGRKRMLSYAIEAVTDCEVAVIPLSRLPELLRKAPSVALTLMQSMQDSLANAYDSLTDVGRRSAREAVANFLFRMDGRIRAAIGERADGSLEFPLTQENIGDALGLTAVHVCRTLRALGREGVVCAGRKGLLVYDRDRLAEIAGAEPDYMDGTQYAVAV